jgi:DNA polymerase III subunit beta
MKLRDAINLAASAVPRTSTLPIISCLALKASGEAITAIGSNLELGVEVTTEFKSKPFEACVDAERFKQALSSMSEPTITVDDGKMLIKQGRTRATLPVFAYTDHPGMPDMSGATGALNPEAWSLIERVAFASAKNDVRYFLNGVAVQSDGKKLSAIASDGHRMVVASEPSDLPPFKIIVPFGNIKTLLAIRPSQISIGSCLVGIRESAGSTVRVFSKLIQGNFPDWPRLMTSHQLALNVDTATLREAIKTVLPFSNDKFKGARLTWGFSALSVTAKNEAQAESVVEIDCEADTESEIGVNVVYLSEALASVRSASIAIQYKDQNTALRIDDGNTTYIVMPMRL